MFPTFRTAVHDPAHFNADLWSADTLKHIQDKVSSHLQAKQIKKHLVSFEQIRSVVDSVAESNPRVGTDECIRMVISYIVNYIDQEETVNNTPAYDSSVLLYDGNFGIQRFSQGSIGIKKKGLNRIGRMF